MLDRSPRVSSRSTLLLLAPFALAAGAAAQARMDVRESMQLAGQSGSSFWSHWPLKINDFAVGDVDGDGDLDLLAARNEFGARIWRNDGDGAFLQLIPVSGSNSGSRRAALFDADADGDLDAFLAGGRTGYGGDSGSLLLRNDGLGNFTNSPTLPDDLFTNAHDHNVVDLGVGDVDGDGDQDVVLFTLTSSPRIHVWHNDGTGTFTDATAASFPGGHAPSNSPRGELTDIDGDGDLDLLQNAVLYRNDGLGAFTHDPGWSTGFSRAVDLDGDGDLDFVDATQVRINDGVGNFTALGFVPPAPPPAPVTQPTFVDTNEIWAVDMDGDGLKDLVGTFWESTPTLLRNTGGFVYEDVTATWFEPHARIRPTVDAYWTASIVFDIDGDGRPDLVTGGTEGRNAPVSTTVGTPPKVFVNATDRLIDARRPAFPFLQTCATAIDSGDLDGDGDVDLVLGYDFGYFATTQGSVFLQDDAGHFESTTGLQFGPGVVRLFDADGDGDLDLLQVAGWGLMWPGVPGPHRLFLNDGAAGFTDVTATHMPATAVSGGAGCACGDVDGDGDLDLVIGAYDPVQWYGNGVPLMLLRNDGSGVFTDDSASLPQTLCQAGTVDLIDLDGDGDLDLLVGTDNQHRLTEPVTANYLDSLFAFRNDGAGHFTDVTAQSVPPGSFVVGTIRDVDGDGDPDLMQGNRRLLNDGTGVFTEVVVASPTGPDLDEDGVGDDVAQFAQQDGAEDLVRHAVDLDGDGDLDTVIGPAMAFGNPYWNELRVEVLYNLRRDLRVATLPRVGKPYRLHLRAGNGAPGAATAVLPALSIGRLPQPVALPGLGALVLDPATTMLLPLAVVPAADAVAEIAIAIPNDAQFLGLPLTCQALFGNGPPGQLATLSNALTYRIAR